jgi:DNA topoisomerase-1
MPKSLVIVESPAKAKTINKILGSEYTVTSSMGHIIDLPKKKLGIDVEHDFKPEFVVMPERKKYLTELKKSAAEAESIYLATDPDREGEAISWHLKERLKNGKKFFRVVFHEITAQAVKEAFQHPAEIDLKLVEAQQARRILDRLVGYNLSPLLWQKIGRGLSAGRVQSVAVKLIVERENEIKAFMPKEYWEIEAELKKQSKKGHAFKAKLEKIEDKAPEIANKEQAEAISREIEKETFSVLSIEKKEKKKNPLPPYTTSKLQQDAFNKLHFPAYKTMRVAQELYEGVELGEEGSVGLITYMRTDSFNLAPSAIADAREYIQRKFGKEYLPAEPNFYKSKKNAQQAHEAIRPTLPLREPESVKQFLTAEQFKLYQLVWQRFLACQMNSAVYLITAVWIKAGRFLFKASGSDIIFAGYTIVFGKTKDEEDEKAEKLPELAQGEPLSLIKLFPSQHFTQGPPRYSDASLVKALEEYGIGRPSTYAPIIQTIVFRDYVRRNKGYFFPTDLGFVVTDLLNKNFTKIMDLQFTAHMEEELDEIESGEMNSLTVLKEFYAPFLESLNLAKENVKKEVIATDKICEKCGRPMIIKWGRNGRFLSCSGFPACKHAAPLGTGIKCPQAGCGGEVVERRSKRGRIFYGCSRYPECNFVSKNLPEEKATPEKPFPS